MRFLENIVFIRCGLSIFRIRCVAQMMPPRRLLQQFAPQQMDVATAERLDVIFREHEYYGYEGLEEAQGPVQW
jgi:hypothetical protein